MSSVKRNYDFSHLRRTKEIHNANLTRKGDEAGEEWSQKVAEYNLLQQIAKEVTEGDYDMAVAILKTFCAQDGGDAFLFGVFRDHGGCPSDAYLVGFVEGAARVFDAFEAAEG